MRKRDRTAGTKIPKGNQCGCKKKVVEHILDVTVYGSMPSVDTSCVAVFVAVFQQRD